MLILNYTPHPIHICNDENQVIKTIESTGLVRLKASTVYIEHLDGVKITQTQFSEPVGLPEYNKDVFYIVSQLVKTALPNRLDLLVPAEVVRGENGNIIGCKSLGI